MLKVVLLHNGNEYPTIPIGYSTSLKENYDDLKFVFDALSIQIKYLH